MPRRLQPLPDRAPGLLALQADRELEEPPRRPRPPGYDAPEGVFMRSSTSDLGWMARVLAGLDCPFVVERPPELREALKRRAAEIARLAERGG